jgi:hypothetical protein
MTKKSSGRPYHVLSELFGESAHPYVILRRDRCNRPGREIATSSYATEEEAKAVVARNNRHTLGEATWRYVHRDHLPLRKERTS